MTTNRNGIRILPARRRQRYCWLRPFPPTIDSERPAMIARLAAMERELNGGAR